MLLDLTDLSSESLQNQIIGQVRARILSGELAAASSLPSIRALARDHRVSVITVQRAYEELMRQGLIHSRRGKGFFVSDLSGSIKKEMARQRLNERLRPLVEAAFAEGLSRRDVARTVDGILDGRGRGRGPGKERNAKDE